MKYNESMSRGAENVLYRTIVSILFSDILLESFVGLLFKVGHFRDLNRIKIIPVAN